MLFRSSGLTSSEKTKILEASNMFTGRKIRTWPKNVERAHMVEPISVSVGGKDYSYHPGLMFIQGRKINQATKSSGPGATGLQVVQDFESLMKKGVHPGSLLLQNANSLGYPGAQIAITNAYEEIAAVLSSPKYRDTLLGGKTGAVSLESITGPILKKHLSKLRKEGNRNFFDDVFHQGGKIGRAHV